MPVRRGALGRAWRALRASEGQQRRRLTALWAAGAAPVLALCVALGVVASQAQPQEPPSYLRSDAAIHTETTAGSADSAAGDKTVQETGTALPEAENPAIARRSAAAGATDREAGASGATGEKKTTGHARDKKAGHAGQEAAVGPVSAVGDSVMLGAAGELEKTVPNVATIDAEVGFQAADAIAVLEARRYAGELGEVVVVHIGSNGVFTAEQFDQTMGALEGVRRVVFVNVNVPRPWAQPNNEVIADRGSEDLRGPDSREGRRAIAGGSARVNYSGEITVYFSELSPSTWRSRGRAYEGRLHLPAAVLPLGAQEMQ
jgi:limonene-1,2-epoxide hydrolase